MAKEKIKRKQLILEIEDIIEVFSHCDKPDVAKYVRQCPTDFDIQPTTYLEQWVTGFRLLQQTATRYRPGDVQNYFSPILAILRDLNQRICDQT